MKNRFIKKNKKSNISFYLITVFLCASIFLGLYFLKRFTSYSYALENNSSLYVGYGIKDISPMLINYNDSEINNPNMPIVYDCDDNSNVVTNAVNPLPLSGHGAEMVRATSNQCVDKDSHITVSAIAVKDDNDNYVIFVETDFTGFTTTYTNGFTVATLRQASVNYIKDELGIDIEPSHIMMLASHSHAAPGGNLSVDQLLAYNDFYVRRQNEAIKEAIQDMEKATLTYDTFEVYLDQNGDIVENGSNIPDTDKKRLNFVRHYITDNYFYENGDPVIRDDVHGLYGLKCTDSSHTSCSDTYSTPVAIGHTREADYDMQVIRIDYANESKSPVLMVNWQAHPVIQGAPDRAVISADFVGYFRNYLNSKGYRVAYYNGAAGDIVPRTFIPDENIVIDGKSLLYGISNATQAKFAASKVGEKLGELTDERLKDSNLFTNTIDPKNGIKFYIEDNKSEEESNKIQLKLRRWNEIDENGNNVFNDTILYNAYFIDTINKVVENDILNGTDNFKRIVNGDYTLDEWKANWNYSDIDFKFPPYFTINENNNVQTVSEKLVSLLRAHNSLYSNKFIFEENDQGVYKLTGYKNNTYPQKSTLNSFMSLIGESLDDLNTSIDERIYSRTHASVVLGHYNRTTDYSNLEFETFTIGDFGFITAPYEMFSSSGIYIKENSPFSGTFVLPYANGRISYIPDADTFNYKSYETDITIYEKGTAERDNATLINRLNSLYDWSASDWYSSYDYTIEDNNIILTKYNGTDEIIYVPSKTEIDNTTYNTVISGEVYTSNTVIKYVTFEDGVKAGSSLKNLFRDCSSLKEVNLNNFDTSNTIDMSYMFYGCTSLESLDISKINTSNVTNMHGMFTICTSLTEISLNNFDTSKVTDMQSMFYGCNKLVSLNISSFNTESVTNFISMFHGCTALTSLNLGSFNTSNATNMYRMFYNCKNLESIYVSDLWDTSKVDSSTEMFWNNLKLKGENGTTYDSSNIDKTYALVDSANTAGYLSGLISDYEYYLDENTNEITLLKYNGNGENIFVPANITINDINYSVFITGNVYENNTSIKYVTFEDGVKAGSNLKNLFKGCTNVVEINLNSFDTSNTTDMSYMFYNCQKLSYLDVSKIDTSNVTNMEHMFLNLYEITELDLTNFDTSKVTNMQSMFYGCKKLYNLNLSSFNTENVTNFVSLFQGCTAINSIDLGNFNTSKVTNMYHTFYNCRNLESVYVSDLWDTSKVTTSSDMFYNDINIKGENGTQFDSSKVDKSYARIDKGETPGYFSTSSYVISKDLKTILTENGYVINDSYVTGFKVGDTIESLISIINDTEVSFITNNVVISTGTIIRKGNDQYSVVLKGDLTGDGKINSGDLLHMRKYLLGEIVLPGPNKLAGIIESINEIRSLDLLRLRQYLLGKYNIEQ